MSFLYIEKAILVLLSGESWVWHELEWGMGYANRLGGVGPGTRLDQWGPVVDVDIPERPAMQSISMSMFQAGVVLAGDVHCIRVAGQANRTVAGAAEANGYIHMGSEVAGPAGGRTGQGIRRRTVVGGGGVGYSSDCNTVKSAFAPYTRDRDRRQSIRIALLRGILLGWRVSRGTAVRRIVRHGRL